MHKATTGTTRSLEDDVIQEPQRPTPAPSPTAPVLAGGRTVASAPAIYEGFKAQRRELSNQLEELESTRRDISSQLQQLPANSPEQKGLETRMTDVDARIATVDQMLASNAAQIAAASAVPGAVVEPPQIIRNGPPEE
ncbi:MAG TPA: hypothetical protein VK491_09230, partial [Gemmatimonadaceae bacterium]|nr:hypothetical protein [Gemmatimonadaceae bacterium]